MERQVEKIEWIKNSLGITSENISKGKIFQLAGRPAVYLDVIAQPED